MPPATAKIPLIAAPPAPETADLAPPETEHVSAVRAAAGDGKGDRPRKSDAVRQPGPSADPALRGGAIGTDRVDRSILQAVDLDLGSQRPRVPLPAGAEFWIVAERDPLTDAVLDLLAGQGLKPRLLPWSASRSSTASVSGSRSATSQNSAPAGSGTRGR